LSCSFITEIQMRIGREISCYKQPVFMGEQLQQLNRFIQFRVRLSMTLEVLSVEVCQFGGTFFLVSHRMERQPKLSNFSLTFLSYDI